MKNLQQMADDTGRIGETVEALHKLLDKFQADHGDEGYARIEQVWPSVYHLVDPRVFYKLERDLTPPEDR